MTTKADVERISDEELETLFTDAYEKHIASLNNIGSYECSCKRDSGTNDVKVEVMVVGLAGSPTIEAYKDGKVENSDRVVIDRTEDDRPSLVFDHVPEEDYILNANDYSVVYKLV